MDLVIFEIGFTIRHDVDSHFNFLLTLECALLIFVQDSISADFNSVNSCQPQHSLTAGRRVSRKCQELGRNEDAGTLVSHSEWDLGSICCLKSSAP